MRILVTGGAGFIGGHLVERLVAEGHELLVVDDLSTGRRANLPAATRLEETTLRAALERGVLADFAPQAVAHLAAQVDAARSVAEPELDARVNVLDTLALLEACRRLGRPRFVFASSAAIYGDPARIPCRESDPARPLNPYGVAKLAAEGYLDVYARLHGLPSAALRFANVYGPRQSTRGEAGVVALFCRELAAGRAGQLHGDGAQTRDYVYVADVVDAVARALAILRTGVWNVGTGIETDVRTVHGQLASRLAPGRSPGSAPARPGDPRRSALSSHCFRRDFGWRPRVSVADGLARTADAYRRDLLEEPA